jgi:hypothetical protein
MEISAAIVGLIGVVLGSFVTYGASKLNFRALVISNNRQDWINALRDSISEFQSILVQLSLQKKYPEVGLTDDRMLKRERASFLYAKIKLLINPNEDDHIELVRLISEAFKRSLGVAEENNDLGEVNINITNTAQKILKREWKRVKKGR